MTTNRRAAVKPPTTERKENRKMKRIEVFDVEAQRLEELSEKYGESVAALVEMMLDNISEDDEEFVFGRG